jgi:hypothetical protein
LSLRQLILDDAPIHAIASLLDGLSPAARIAETRTLGRDAQRRLYGKAGDAAPLSLDDFVPPGVGPRVEVIHHGYNTLPLLPPFEKRFSRPDAGGDGLYGYNETLFKNLIGPGYFTAVPTAGKPTWEARGSIVIDYFRIPDGPVPAGWPAVVPNTSGLQRFVYHRLRDYMRRVSTHVTIGAAFREEEPLGHYFILCRDDAAT